MKDLYYPNKKTAEKIINKFGSPCFVTNASHLDEKVKNIKDSFENNLKIFYAIKANYNPHIVKRLKKAGIDGIDTVSPFEVTLAKEVGFTENQIIFTGNNSSDQELKSVYEQGCILNIGSISELSRFGKLFPKGRCSIRFNPEIGDGENEKVNTGKADAQFGIKISQFADMKKIIAQYNLSLIGIHCHIGSGFYTPQAFTQAVKSILNEAKNFKNLSFVDFGGGFGVRYKENTQPLDLKKFYDGIKDYIKDFRKHNKNNVEFRIEPGKFLVAETTCLLTKVTTIKDNYDNVPFIGTDTGFNHLIRPVLYDSYHHIVNLSKLDDVQAKTKTVNIIGNICETGDVLGKNISIKNPEEGDILAILTAGAYCSSMSSIYNLRPYAAEILIDGDEIVETRKRLNFQETFNHLGFRV